MNKNILKLNVFIGPNVKRNTNYLLATTLMLKQLFIVMIECVVQPTESIARLGCACIRYVQITSRTGLLIFIYYTKK
jgi:hypothetical protein